MYDLTKIEFIKTYILLMKQYKKNFRVNINFYMTFICTVTFIGLWLHKTFAYLFNRLFPQSLKCMRNNIWEWIIFYVKTDTAGLRIKLIDYLKQ